MTFYHQVNSADAKNTYNHEYAMTKQRAFTLIELSIVLVIIGLIVGGVLVGKDLVEAAQLRQIGVDFEKVSAATNTFKNKYNCLPGDCKNATQFFPAGGCGYWGAASDEIPTAVCNGNGDGTVGGVSTPTPWGENFYFWRTLQAANLFDTGIVNLGRNCAGYCCGAGVAGTDSAQGKFNKDAMLYITEVYYTFPIDCFVSRFGNPAAQGYNSLTPSNYTNAIAYGKSSDGNGGTGYSPGGILSPRQAGNVDSKFDDGYANTGRIVGMSWAANVCTNATTSTPTNYLNNNGSGCGIVYLRAF